MLRRKIALILSGLVMTGSTLFGLATISSATVNNSVFDCDVTGPKVQNEPPSDAGGSLILLGVVCNGHKDLLVDVEVKAGGKILFRLQDQDNVRGNVEVKKAIHLPILLPPDAAVCVTVIDTVAHVERKCIGIDLAK